MAIEYRVIGRHIRDARKQKHMTQEAVAEAIDMSCAHYGKVERGERTINLQRLSELSDLFGVTLESLLVGAEGTEGRKQLVSDSSVKLSDFASKMEFIAKGCTEKSLRLMLRLCADVAESDKQE